MTGICGMISGSNICQRLPHGESTQHEDTGTYWGSGIMPVAPTQMFFCTTCHENFTGGDIADEPVCACSCIYEDAGGHGRTVLVNNGPPEGVVSVSFAGKPHWIIFEAVRDLDEAGVSGLLKRVGYTYPRLDDA